MCTNEIRHEGGSVVAIKEALISHKFSDDDTLPLLQNSLPVILDLIKAASGLGEHRVQACDAMSIWLLRASQVCAFESARAVLAPLLSDAEATYLFHYVVDFWNDSGAPLGNSLRTLFAKLIVFLKKANGDKHELFEEWLVKALRMPNTMKILYFMVEHLSKETNPTFVIDNHPEFVSLALAAMWSNALANPAGKSIQTMFKNVYSHYKQTKVNPDEEWLQLWKTPVARALKDANLRKNVEVYLLPYLFKTSPVAYKLFVRSLMVDETLASQEDYMLVLGCLKIGQNLAIVVEPFISVDNEPPVISLSTLRLLLAAQDSQLKISALSLLVSSPKGSKIVVPEVFQVVYDHLDMFFVENDLETRNEVFSLLRQFIVRVKDASYSLQRDSKKLKARDAAKSEELQVRFEECKRFISKLLDYITGQMLPNSTHQRLSMAFKLFEVFVRTGIDPNIDAQFLQEQQISWPFQLTLFGQDQIRYLLDNILNDYDDIRQTAADLLLMVNVNCISNTPIVSGIEEASFEMLKDMKGRTGDSAARMVQLFHEIDYRMGDLDACLKRTENLRDILVSSVATAKTDMVTAVYQKNVHGYFSALKLTFATFHYGEFLDFDKKRIRDLLESLIEVIFDVWTVVKPILSDDSPEGNLPPEFKSLIGSEIEEKYGAPTQIISSYSWRAVKESSAFLKELMDKAPEALLDNGTTDKFGDMIMDQLSSVKHRGAFSSVYPTFIACCERCNRSRSNMNTKPQQWLQKNISLIQRKTQSITRRSGGLPFLVTAILTSDKQLYKSKILEDTMAELFKISREPYKDHGEEKMDIPQVHAMNCIKAIFTESHLADASAHFVDEALDLVLSKFGSPTWSIRNCAVMLFTALQNRLFGTKNVSEGLSSISARLFFSRFKNVKNVLYNNLSLSISRGLERTENIETVFPILTIISRLEATPGYHGLDDFQPLLWQCLENRDWKVRENAARALPALVAADELREECIRFLSTDASRQNRFHGALLAVKELLLTHFNRSGDAKNISELKDMVEAKITQHFSNFTSNVTKKALLDVYKLLLRPSPDQLTPSEQVIFCLGHFYVSRTMAAPKGLDATEKSLLADIVPLLLTYHTSAKRHDDIADCIQLFLSSDYFEVQMEAINFYTQSVINLSATEKSVLTRQVWDLVSTESTWIYVKSAALKLLNLLLLHEGAQNLPRNSADIILKLFSNQDSVEIRCSSIEALGPLVAREIDNRDWYVKWSDIVRGNSADSAPLDLRVSTLKSVASFLEITAASFKSEWLLESSAALFNFLSDDDEDVRSLSAQALSSLMGLKFPTEPIVVAAKYRSEYLPQHFSSSQISALLLQKPYFFHHVEVAELPKLLSSEDENLFTVEKDNFYRDHVTDLLNYRDLLKSTEANINETELRRQFLPTLTQPVGGWGRVNNETFYTAATCALVLIKTGQELSRKSSKHFLEQTLNAYSHRVL